MAHVCMLAYLFVVCTMYSHFIRKLSAPTLISPLSLVRLKSVQSLTNLRIRGCNFGLICSGMMSLYLLLLLLLCAHFGLMLVITDGVRYWMELKFQGSFLKVYRNNISAWRNCTPFMPQCTIFPQSCMASKLICDVTTNQLFTCCGSTILDRWLVVINCVKSYLLNVLYSAVYRRCG